MSCLFTTIPGNVWQVPLYMYLIQAREYERTQNSDKQRCLRIEHYAICWLVGWLDSGPPTLMIWHHSLVLSLSGLELNKGEQCWGTLQLYNVIQHGHAQLVSFGIK